MRILYNYIYEAHKIPNPSWMLFFKMSKSSALR